MRIAQVAPSYHPQIGGVETHVQRLSEGCSNVGDHVTILTHQFRGTPAEEWINGIRVLRFPLTVSSRNYPISLGMFQYLKVHAGDFDIVHGHNYHSIVGHAALGSRLPFIFTPHYNASGHTRFRTFLHRLYRRVGNRQFAAATVVVCVSEGERKLLTRDFPIVVTKVITIPNGTSLRLPTAGADMPMALKPMVLAVGRLERYKNIDLVIDAFRALPWEATLMVVGDGPDRARLERYARTTAPGWPIHFTGKVPESVLDRLFAQASVVTSASDHEAFGLTLAEGLASGARVVASAIPAHADLAHQAGSGAPFALVDPRDTRQFSNLLEAFLLAGRTPAGEVSLPSWADTVEKTRRLYLRVSKQGHLARGQDAI